MVSYAMDASIRNSINVPKWTSPAMWVVTTSSRCSRVRNWLARCERIIASLNALAQGLFDYTARERGGIDAEDRHGCPRLQRVNLRSAPTSQDSSLETCHSRALGDGFFERMTKDGLWPEV